MPILAFEGVDGSGKSTLMQQVALRLRQQGLPVETFREPGSTPLGEAIRQWLTTANLKPLTELFLLEASRHELACLIQEKLKENSKTWVLLDRFAASSVAFQGFGRQLPLWFVQILNSAAIAWLSPDLYVWVQIPVAQAQKRLQTRTQLDRFEKESLDFWQRVHEGYRIQAEMNPKAWLVLDGQKDPEQLTHIVLNHLKERGWLNHKV